MSQARRLPLPAVLLCLHSAAPPHTNSRVLLCLPSLPPPRLASRLPHSALFCLEIKARRVGSVGAGVQGEALPLAPGPATQVPPDLAATGWLCLQPERRPRFLRSRRVLRRAGRFCFVSTEEGPNMDLQLHISAGDFLGSVPTLPQWRLTKPAEHHGCKFSLRYNTDDVRLFYFLATYWT